MSKGKTKVGDKLKVPPRHNLMAVRQQIICQLYEKGYRLTEIATITGIDKSSVSRALKDCEVEITNQPS